MNGYSFPQNAAIAQLAEHPVCNRAVVGSWPTGGFAFEAKALKTLGRDLLPSRFDGILIVTTLD